VHAALFCTWLPLAALVLSAGGNRGDTMGFDVGVAWTGFWWTQFEAVVRYLALSFWPHPLIFDYGNEVTATWREALPWAAPVAILAMAAVVAIVRRSPVGFLGAWFFGILAPTCFVPSVVQAIVEHRMYLPLAAVLTGTVVLASRILSRPVFLSASAALALAAGATTFVRNADYATDEALWRDTVAKRPENARAHNNLGRAVERQGRLAEAAESYRRAAELQSDYGQAHYNHGLALFKLGRPAEALAPFDRAVAVLPHFALAHLNRGLALRALGRFGESLASLEEAVRHPPPIRQAHFHLAVALAEQGRRDEALIHYRAALRLDPADAAARLNLGILLGQEGRLDAAIAELSEAARLAPAMSEAFANLGTALLQAQRHEEALVAFERALAFRPDDPQAHYNVGYALLVSNRWIEARRRFEEALRLDPGHGPARSMMANMGAVP
jgi:tetratricopeptide (TPR) repeat protein